MILETVATYLAKNLLDYFVTEKISKKINDSVSNEKYQDALISCIYKTVELYEEKYPIKEENTKFPFYHSQILIDELSRFILFNKESATLSIDVFEKNPNIIVPTEEQLKTFYFLFIEQVENDKKLKDLFIDTNYKERIIENSQKLNTILYQLEEILNQNRDLKSDTTDIKKDTKEILTKMDGAFYVGKYLTPLPLLDENNIIERIEDLDDLRLRLMRNSRIVIVNGMGGIGKTVLAQRYLTKYLQEYKHVVWIDVSDGYINGFNNIDLIRNLSINIEDKVPEDIFNEITSKLQNLKHQEKENSLLILDDTNEDLSSVYVRLPHPPKWHILSTSRYNLDSFDVKKLEFLNENQALQLFKLRYKRKEISDEEIAVIVRELEYHAQTIDILARTADLDDLDLHETLATLSNDYETDITDVQNRKITKITSFLISLFNLSNLNDNEIWILKQFYYLPSLAINYETLKEVLKNPAKEKSIKLSRFLTKLVNKGWLNYNQSTESYYLHMVIREVIKHSMEVSSDELISLLKSITSMLSIDQTKDNPIDKFKWIPYGKHLLEFIPLDNKPEISVLQNNLALVLKDLGDYEGAKVLLEKAKESAEQNFGEMHPTTAVSYSNLALVLKDLGDYEGAKVLLEKALKILKLI